MSAHAPTDRRTEADNQLNYHAIDARLTVDAEELRLFVDHHPNPTPAIVLGWAEADPQHREAVERWLAARDRRHADQLDDLRDSFEGSVVDEDGRQFTDHGGDDV